MSTSDKELLHFFNYKKMTLSNFNHGICKLSLLKVGYVFGIKALNVPTDAVGLSANCKTASYRPFLLSHFCQLLHSMPLSVTIYTGRCGVTVAGEVKDLPLSLSAVGQT